MGFFSQDKLTIIAEGGVAHFGDLEEAYRLASLAKECGCDFFKLQHFYVDELVNRSYLPEWHSRLKSRSLSLDHILKVAEYCKKINISFLCTPHDQIALEDLDNIVGLQIFKIGSGEKLNFPFLKKFAQTKKPLILSTGMYSHQDISDSLEFLNQEGAGEVAVLHCVTNYPTELIDTSLLELVQIKKYHLGAAGWSDHTKDETASLLAIALGANIIERHITIQTNVPNAQDWKVSSTPENLLDYVQKMREAFVATRISRGKPQTSELASVEWATKAGYFRGSKAAGHVLTIDDVWMARPGIGVNGRRILELIGKQLKRSVTAGQKICEDDFE